MIGKIQQFKSFYRNLCLSADFWKFHYWGWQDQHKRNVHCKHGFHYWYPITLELNNKTYSYLKCPWCETKFFASVKEKQRYLKMKKLERKGREKWLQRI